MYITKPTRTQKKERRDRPRPRLARNTYFSGNCRSRCAFSAYTNCNSRGENGSQCGDNRSYSLVPYFRKNSIARSAWCYVMQL